MKKEETALSRFSQVFLDRFRVTFLIIIGVILLGYISYTQLINKEGFPSTNIPMVLVTGVYQTNDIQKVEKEVTTPLETIAREIDIVESIQSNTTENTFNLVLNLTSGTSLKEGQETIEKAFSTKYDSPEKLKYEVFTIDAGKYYGEYDVVVNLYGETSDARVLQDKAEILKSLLAETKGLVKAEVIPLISSRTDALTGETVEILTSFNKIGVDEDNELKFYNAVSVGLLRREATSVLEFSKNVSEQIETIQKEEEFKGYALTSALDFAPAIDSQLSSLEQNFFGAMITLALVVLFLINIRASIVVLIFIPLIVTASILTLYLSGISLNIISLFSLIMVLGLFVDNVVVIVEAVDQYKQRGQGRRESLRNAIKDVGPAYIVGTLVNILVFVPMLFISGILGDFIRLIPITVIISASLSVFFTLTVVAALSALLIRSRKASETKLFSIKNIPNIGGDLANKLGQKMGGLVRFYLQKKWIAFILVLFSVCAVIFGGFFATKLEFNIFPQQSDTDSIQAELTYPEGTTLVRAQEKADEFDAKLQEFDQYIKRVIYENGTVNGATVQIDLTSMKERNVTSQELKEQIQSAVNGLEGVRINIDVISAGPPAELYPFQIQVYGNETDDLRTATDEIKNFLTKQEVQTNSGVTVRLKDIEVRNLTDIAKNDGRRYATIRANFEDNNQADTLVVQTLQNRVIEEFSEEKLASLGITARDAIGTDLGFQSESLESFESTIVAFFMALLVMYIVLVIQYNSYSLPLLIFAAIPFSFPGLFPGLYLTDNSLSFFVALGIIALAGIVVNNTIVLVDYANTALEETGSIRESIARAIALRFRPILVSSLTTIVGLLPLGLSDPFWEGLAFTIVFGFASSTLFVVLVFPIYYTGFQVARRWIKQTAIKVVGRD